MKIRSAAALTALALAASLAVADDKPGIDPANMDPSAKPCENFYAYADGGWLAKNPIPPDYPEWGAFSELEQRNVESLRKILEQLAREAATAAAGSDERKLGDFYGACMDEKAIEAQGLSPLQPELDRIGRIASPADLQTEIARLQLGGANAVFAFGSEQDRKNSADVIAAAFQGGLGLPDRDYYLKPDDESKEIRAKYAAHMTRMFALSGVSKAKAAAAAKTVLALETRMAAASMDRVERRDSDKTYNRMDATALARLTPSFSWPAYFRNLGMTAAPAAVNIGQPKFFEAVSKLLGETPLEDWKTYLRWKLLLQAAPSLSSKFVDENFDFFGRTLEGTPQNLPRWKRCVAAADNAMGMALGKIWVAEYFPPESKRRADEMIRNMIAALGDDLKTLPWMGEETRKAALHKLSTFDPKIGYPSRWRDYSALAIGHAAHVTNVMTAAEFEAHRDLAKVGKPVDRTEWEITPPTVNAYYNPLRNEIVFPAGILQPPFFDGKADDAVNYGGIGAVIGHEMTHGFDDEGRKFDAEGNLTNWWTPKDLESYQARAECVERQFSGYVVEKGLNVNGKLVLGESIADLGGLKIAYNAFRKSLEGKPEPEKIAGLTADQRFFLSFGRVWATNDRPEFARLITKTNEHPLDRFRAIGAPSNMAEFARAFSCTAGDPMVRSEVCAIW